MYHVSFLISTYLWIMSYPPQITYWKLSTGKLSYLSEVAQLVGSGAGIPTQGVWYYSLFPGLDWGNDIKVGEFESYLGRKSLELLLIRFGGGGEEVR